MKRIALAAILLASTTLTAQAYSVYAGCTMPGAGSGKVWYVDAVKGKTPAAGGLGTQAAPWNSLQGVLSSTVQPGYTRPLLSSIPYSHVTSAGRVDIADTVGNPPVGPGDTIMLMSGNYGDIVIGEYAIPVTNSDFVTVEAAPGQVPLFTTLYVRSANRWVFSGIKVQSLNGTNGNKLSLVTITDQGSALQTTDIILQYLTVDSDPALTGWTVDEMVNSFRAVGIDAEGTGGGAYTKCISVTNSHIWNVTYGSQVMANNELFANNEIDHDQDDMIDYAASNILISRNYLHDSQSIEVWHHMDGMQGYPIRAGSTVTTYSNVVIDSNRIIRQTDPNLQFPGYLQGIDAFDGDWTNMTVTNNVIVTSSCWGIDLAAQHNSLIANNTVATDGVTADESNCFPMLAVGGPSHISGTFSSNTRVTNNIAPHFGIGGATDTGMSYDHNVSLSGYQPFSHWAGSPPVFSYGTANSTDANGNVAAPYPAGFPNENQFAAFNTSTWQFNLMLLPGSVALGAGISGAGLPTVDFNGTARTIPYAAGAYAAPTSKAVTLTVK